MIARHCERSEAICLIHAQAFFNLTTNASFLSTHPIKNNPSLRAERSGAKQSVYSTARCVVFIRVFCRKLNRLLRSTAFRSQ